MFSILSPFNRCINCTCRRNISREIYFRTNPTHRPLSKMVGRSVENEIEIRADIKTRALLSRGSTDIYADICTVYVSNSMSFSTVCRQVMPRSHIHGLDAGLATDTIWHHLWESVDFRVVSVIIRSSICTSLTILDSF